MKGNKLFRIFGGLMILALLLSTVSLPVKAQESTTDGELLQSSEATLDAPEIVESATYSAVPPVTEEQLARLAQAQEETNLSPAIDASTTSEVLEAPESGTDTVLNSSRVRSGEPQAPGDALMYRRTIFGGSIPGGFKSNVMESSTSGKGNNMFFTGNWFAAFSLNKGASFTYKSSYADYPQFCCDQVTIHDDARDMFIWLRMGDPAAWNYATNTFRLSVSNVLPFTGAYANYTISPELIGFPNEWWDYPHMQLGADWLYISWNMFAGNPGTFRRTVMLRLSLDGLRAQGSTSVGWYWNAGWFTFVPVSGADHIMYFASNWNDGVWNNLGIWRWDENSNGLIFWNRLVPGWTGTGRGSELCGAPNWLLRADGRLLTGARYFIQNSNLKVPGRAVLGWWWNVQEGGGFPFPYVNGAAFYEDTMTLVGGAQGRPYFWSNGACFAYPSIAPNARGDLGAVVNYALAGATIRQPRVAFGLSDDYTNAPPGWAIWSVASSSAGASDQKWGDYNTVRNFMLGTTWIAGAHVIYPSAANCSNCSQPVFFSFGRSRDIYNYLNNR